MSKTLRILNVFGITPVGNGVSAGMDFFMPKFKPFEKYSKKEGKEIITAFCKSYGKHEDDLYTIWQELSLEVSALYGKEFFDDNDLNILQLCLCYEPYNTSYTISEFVENVLVFDGNKVPGIWCHTNDYIKVNSGIKLALEHNTCGVFFNKSGKGTKGWDIRACVVDEDYSGYVHISMTYDKSGQKEDGIVYCGDKLTQLLVLPVEHHEAKEITAEEYDKLMNQSKRGDNGFGSSDVKH
jgi:dUTPase